MLNDFDYMSMSPDLITTIIYFITCFFVSGLCLHLAINGKGKKLFLFSSPVIVLVSGVDLIKMFLNDTPVLENLTFLFIITLFFFMLIFGLINLYFNVNPWKRIFSPG